MNTLAAFARGQASRGQPIKYFDWIKAAELIKEYGAKHAAAGLIEDWEWTGGDIMEDGKIIPEEDTYVYLGSTWATPTLIINHWDDEFECWKYKDEIPKENLEYWCKKAREIYDFSEQTITEKPK